jgi:hypothetical protein
LSVSSVITRNTATQIKPNYRDREKVEVMQFADLMALLAAVEMFCIAGRPDLISRLQEARKTCSGAESLKTDEK